MSPHNNTPRPQKSENLPEHLQGEPNSPRVSAPKRPRLSPWTSGEIEQPLKISTTPGEIGSETKFSPGHAPGYLQWKRAPAADLANETEVEKKSRLNKRHAPKRKRGTICIDDGTIDRSPAILGEPDPSKLVLRFKTQETDEYTNKPIQSDVEFRYGEGSKGVPVDWKDTKSLNALNNWRNQVIRRSIGKAYDHKEFWTVQEQKIITELVRDYLNAKKDIDWTQIADDYNSSIEKIEQDKGIPGAPRRYHCKSSHKTPREAVCVSWPSPEKWNPPAGTLGGQRRLGRQDEDGAAARESFDEQESFASSTYETDRSMVEESSKLAPTPPSPPLTHPRPLKPRQMTILQHKAEPSRSRYKKRNVYSEEIVYDRLSPDLHRSSTHFNPSQGPGDRRQALDLLAEQAAIMYDHLPKESKWSAPRPVVPSITPALSAPAPAPIRFRLVTFDPNVSTPNTPVRMPIAPMVPVSKSPIFMNPVSVSSTSIVARENSAESGPRQMTFAQRPGSSTSPLNIAFIQPRPHVPRVPDWEINRQLREKAGEEISEANAKKICTSEPAPEI
ncbi:hypothetical protein BcDW1_8451 [Botrytis cinerea BcDW1]|uniref:Myb-like domain-containing protein n=1 Tax=Botryotinia fuckeliana (strain BcDW1) TaxID=1290391 RepID=M7UH93_BOTF1|nr:hypothetical protein BcDW1_8451 [Botrytis cinerea BcDW1]